MAPATLIILPLTGCEGRLSALDPAGPAAEAIARMWWVMLAGGTAILVLTMALLALAFRDRRPVPDKRVERTFLMGLGLAFPLIVLSALTVWGLIVGERLMPRNRPDLVTVSAEARQWEWRFGYAEAPGRMTRDVLHLPAGRPVDVRITATDVVHSFWVPRLAGKLDAIPGHTNILRIEADAPGEYDGVSAEFSGRGYREHVFKVIVHDASGWDAFLTGGTP